jgi:LacI family transcriptional regulator
LAKYLKSLSERGTMAVNVRDVARKAGVSVGTVSNVLNSPDKVAAKTVEKVQAAIDKLGFIRNDAARQLRAGKSRSIGLIVPDVRNPFFTDLARGAEDAAEQHNMSILLANSDEAAERELALLGLFEEQRVHGVLVTPINEDLEQFKKARDRGTPIVLVDRKSKDKSFSSVSVDDVAGGYMAVKHLIDLGRKRIVFAGGPLQIQQVSDRLKGAKKAVAETPGVILEVLECKSLTVLEGREVGAALSELPKNKRPDAVFAANDLVAIGIMQFCLNLDGFRIPKDLSLIGYDDIAFASTALIALTSIRQPTQEIGLKAVELLMELAGEESTKRVRQIEFQPELVIRDSTKLVG